MKQKLFRTLVVVVLVCALGIGKLVAADDTSATWLTPGNPTLSQAEQLPSGQALPTTITGYGNIDCIKHKFVTKPAMPLLGQAEVSHEACAVQTDFGLVDPAGYIELNGSGIAGKVVSTSGSQQSIVPIPGSKTVVVYENTSNGLKAHFYENINRTVSIDTNIIDRSVTFTLPSSPTKTLEDAAGTDLYVKPSTMTFSANGKWMVVDSEYLATLKVDLTSYQVTPFRSPFTYHLGSDPKPHFAISDDGRFVISAASGMFNIADTQTCAPVTEAITGPVACSNTDVNSAISQHIPGYKRSWQPRFVNDSLISFYVNATVNGTNATSKLRMAPPGAVIEEQDYLALGDSYSSGEGAYDYFLETDTPENKCHLSKVSYPYLIGQELDLQSYNSVACSGAVIRNITDDVQYVNVPDPNTLGGMLPGFRKQLHYVSKVNPDVITVGISGNDIGFGGIVQKCVGNLAVVPGTCYATYEDRFELIDTVNKTFAELKGMYGKIRSTASNAKIYAVGYPKIAQNNGNCAVNVRLDNEEVKFSNMLIEYLNNVISSAAASAGVSFVDVGDAFAGHKLCETESYFVAVNGLTLGGDSPLSGIGPTANASYHPNKLGHQLYKDKILEQTSNFTLANPQPDAAAVPPAITDDLPILDVPRTGREIREVSAAPEATSDLAITGRLQNVALDGDQYALAANTSYQIELHSDPIVLGTFTTNTDGDLTARFRVPSVDPGFHTLHIYGTNMTGQAIDVYKTIYVAAFANDYDGDGIKNGYDSCPAFEQSGQDIDKDKIDDACDGFIDRAPGEGRIAGTVYEDVNGDGRKQKTEPPTAGWGVNLYDEQWSFVATTTTGAYEVNPGKYLFNKLYWGTYYICEVSQSGWQYTGPRQVVEGSVVQNSSPNMGAESQYCHQATIQDGTTAQERATGRNFANQALTE